MSGASEDEKKKLFDLLAKQNARGQQRPPAQMAQNPFGNMFQGGPLLPPPPQMMFGGPPQMHINPQFMRPQYGYQPQQPMFRPPGFQQPGFQQPGFQQPGLQQPGFQPPNNVFSPVVPMPGPKFIPNNQPQGFGFQPQQNPGFGFQPQQNQNFGFQAPQQPQQNGPFGFQINQGGMQMQMGNFGFKQPFGFG